MARLNSFHYPPDCWPEKVGDIVELKGPEAKHMLTVLRSTADQTVRLFDGKGRDGLFRILERNRNRASLEAIQLESHPEPRTGVTLAIGWGKSKRRTYLFEKSVELKGLGVVFWEARRSQGSLPTKPKDTWSEKCIQAAKQCGNPFLPDLDVCPGGVDGLIEYAHNFDACYLAWESCEIEVLLSPDRLADKRSFIVIGPEGGLEDFEAMKLIDSGFKPVTLGNTIMRWETAATYCLSLGWFAQQDMK